MPKFYFHLTDHTEQLLDPEGVECANASSVEETAMCAARDIIAGDAQQGEIDMTCRIDVEDTSHKVVHSLEFEDAVSIKHAA